MADSPSPDPSSPPSTASTVATDEPLVLVQVDAFTDRPFTGNPAAVCLLPEPRDDGFLQAVAREMNLSETAFLLDCEGEWGLRWFTPAEEVDLCGHATLASAHALWEAGLVATAEPVRFHTKSGVLTCERGSGGSGESGGSDEGWIWMDFPALPAEPLEPGAVPPELVEALGGVRVRRAGRSRFDLLVEVGSRREVEELDPDLALVERLDARGLIVTARADDGNGDGARSLDFVSRYFGPRVGVPEDPVTGSAHCVLGPWWAAELGRECLVGRQVSRRGGTVRLQVGDERVRLGGQAVTVLRARLLARADGRPEE